MEENNEELLNEQDDGDNEFWKNKYIEQLEENLRLVDKRCALREEFVDKQVDACLEELDRFYDDMKQKLKKLKTDK